MFSREQLGLLGVDRHFIRNQVRAERWQEVSPVVIATTTGFLSFEQRLWAGVLHAGEPAAVGGLTAAGIAGLRGWDRSEVTIMVPKSESPLVLPGWKLVETRRDIAAMTRPGPGVPVLRLEPAVLLHAAYTRSERTACGLLAAAVQQKLTRPDRLREWVDRLKPLRRSPMFREVLTDIAGGAQSMAEIDIGRVCTRYGLPRPTRQVMRRDRSGRRRYTDCEWELPDGRIVVLEVDGGIHMEVETWWSDMARERDLVIDGRIVLRCSNVEIRQDPGRIVRDLVALGVPCSRPGERGA